MKNCVVSASNDLCMSKSGTRVLEDFHKKFQEPTKHACSVNVNWYIHNVAHAGNLISNKIIILELTVYIDRFFYTALGDI